MRAAGFCPRRPRSIEFAKLFRFRTRPQRPPGFTRSGAFERIAKLSPVRRRHQSVRFYPPCCVRAASPSIASGISPCRAIRFYPDRCVRTAREASPPVRFAGNRFYPPACRRPLGACPSDSAGKGAARFYPRCASDCFLGALTPLTELRALRFYPECHSPPAKLPSRFNSAETGSVLPSPSH